MIAVALLSEYDAGATDAVIVIAFDVADSADSKKASPSSLLLSCSFWLLVMQLGEIGARIKNLISAASKFFPVKAIKCDAKPTDGKRTLRVGLTVPLRKNTHFLPLVSLTYVFPFSCAAAAEAVAIVDLIRGSTQSIDVQVQFSQPIGPLPAEEQAKVQEEARRKRKKKLFRFY